MSIDERKLAQAIEQQHGCSAEFVRAEKLDAALHNHPEWDGSVAVFSVDHPETDTCYAWSQPFDVSDLPWQTLGSTPTALFAVLKQPPVDSPADAWRRVDGAVAKLAEHELKIAPTKVP
jgi:hypothetical protein